MKYKEFTEIANRIAQERMMNPEDVEFSVSMDPNDIPAEQGVRYFGEIHELMCHQGEVIICATGDKNH